MYLGARKRLAEVLAPVSENDVECQKASHRDANEAREDWGTVVKVAVKRPRIPDSPAHFHRSVRRLCEHSVRQEQDEA